MFQQTALEKGYQLRLAQLNDIPVLRDIEVGAVQRFVGLNIMDDMLDDSMSPARLTELINLKQVWVVCFEGAPIGFAASSEIEDGYLLEEVDVLPEHGGKGIGRLLVEKVVDHAREQNYPAVILSTFRDVPWNAAFYSKLGFQPIEESNLTDGLLRLRDNEIAIGLPIADRVFMRLLIEQP